jgi:hypothetical protein
MKRLDNVHAKLGRLRRSRATVRLGAAASRVLTVLLWALAAAFLLDYSMRMGQLERGIVLVVVAVVLVRTVARHLVPALQLRESDSLLAVLVDRRQGTHSDLVAAVQFGDGVRPQYGSAGLREAVVDGTVEKAGGLNFLEGFSRAALARRLAVFAVTAAVCLAPAVAFSGHAGAFLNRLLLRGAHYPTRTVIEEIVSPGDRAAYGRPVTFAVRIGGERPPAARVRLAALSTGLKTTVELKPGEKDPGLYTGTLGQALDDLTYTVYAGDARSDPRRLTLIPLPLVELAMKVVAPDYARARAPAKPQAGRQVVVLQGSRVVPTVTADKPLASAVLVADADGREFPMTRRGKAFVLESGPLENVMDTLRFEIRVKDADGLSPENPVKGVVQVSADLPPRVALTAHSRFVVPGATPELRFRAVDDFGLDHVTLHRSIIRAEAEGEQKSTATLLARVKDHAPRYGGAVKLPLAKLGLQKGDQVVVTVEAADYRGPFASRSRRSGKWVFEVTDQAGVLAAMEQLNEQVDGKLDEVLRAQLEAGK